MDNMSSSPWHVLLVGCGEFASRVAETLRSECDAQIEPSAVDAAQCVSCAVDFDAIVVTSSVARSDLATLRSVFSVRATPCPVVQLLENLDPDLLNQACFHGWFAAVWPLSAGWMSSVIESSIRAQKARTERALRESFEKAVRPTRPWKLEDEVCWKTMLGAQAKDLARELGLKEKTVYGMRDRTRHRLGVSSISDLREIVTKPILPDWRRTK